jgi:glycosyltransferase involved in cell wall biosynthesis
MSTSTRYRGAVDGLFGRHIRGWVQRLDDSAERAMVELWLRGEWVGRVVADELRSDLEQAGVGDGRHGFSFELPTRHDIPDGRVLIEVTVAGETWRIPPTPSEYCVPADGRIEKVEGGALRGWVYGPGYTQARLDIFSGSDFALSWPCAQPRNDFLRIGIQGGLVGFVLPLAALEHCEPTGLLKFVIGGTDVVLSLPCSITDELERSALARIVTPPQPAMRSAAEARRALTRGIGQAALNPSPDARDQVLLSVGHLQRMLNRLSELSTALGTETAFQERFSTGREPRPPLHSDSTARQHAMPASSRIGRELERLAAISQSRSPHALTTLIDERLLPGYRDEPELRHILEAALATHQDVKLLRAIAMAFRRRAFLKVAAIAYGRSLEIAQDDSAEGLRHVENFLHLETWTKSEVLSDKRFLLQKLTARPARPRALYAVWRSIPYDTNGYTIRSHYLLRGLRKAGQDVVAVTRMGYLWDAGPFHAASATVEYVDGILYVHLGGQNANNSPMPLTEYVDDVSERLAQLAILSDADIIHSTSNWLVGLPALRAARLIGLPFSYEIRGLLEITRASNEADYRKTDHFDLCHQMEGFVAREADLVFSITGGVRDEMAARGVDRDKVLIAPNGVELERFSPMRRDADLVHALGVAHGITFGFVGTFAKYEGIPDLCEAACTLRRSGRKFHLLLVGDGPDLEVAKTYRDNENDGTIIITGRVPYREVPRYYSLIDVAVFPRRGTEITELVAALKPFEAMAMGKPVITSNVTAMAEIIQDGDNGWIYQKSDISSLTRTMECVLDHPEEIALRGHRAREFVRDNHDWQVIASRVASGWQAIRRSANVTY